VALQVYAYYVESDLREPVQELLVEQGMRHRPRQDNDAGEPRLPVHTDSAMSVPEVLDQDFLLRFHPLNGIQQSL